MVLMEPEEVIVPRQRTIIHPDSPLGLVVQFIAPLCAFPCVHSSVLLEGLCTISNPKESVLDNNDTTSFAQFHEWHTVSSIAKTPHLNFVGGLLEEVPPTPSFKSPQGTSNMSGEDDDDAYHYARGGVDEEDGAQFLGTQQYDNEFVNDADLLDDLMNPGGGNDDDPLPALRNIWDCPMINKSIGFDQKTMKSYEGWSCGWCMNASDHPPFRGANASKALWHVLRESGHDIRPCKGNIPENRMRQYRDLSQTKALQKDARAQRSASLSSNIDDLQDRTVDSMTEGGRRSSWKGEASAHRSSLKEPCWAITETSSLSSSTPRSNRRSSTSFFQSLPKRTKKVGEHQEGGGGMRQMKLYGNAIDPQSAIRMDVAISDFIHSNCLPFSLAEDSKLMTIINIARNLGGNYMPPSRKDIGGRILDALYITNWKDQMHTLLSEAKVFGITVFGDGATIKTVPLVNVLAAGVNNPFALLDISDCSNHLSKGQKKDAHHIASIIIPLIKQIESESNVQRKKSPGIVDLVLFDGASNVQNAGLILKAYNPRITVGHGAEHVVSLFFSDVYKKVSHFKKLSDFAKKVRNIFGAVRHSPSAMFKKYSRLHNKGIAVGFIKPSECRMAGEHIALLRLLRLKNALQATITSKEFMDLKVFHSVTQILLNNEFWKYLYVMCRALYAPMRVLRLADQKSAAMDKLYYYVLQTDRMLQKYITDAEERADVLLTQNTWEAMETTQPAGMSDSEEEEDDFDEDSSDGEDVIADNTESVDSDISDEDKQVLMVILLRLFNLSNSVYASYSHQQQ